MYNSQNSELFGCRSNLFNNIIKKINKSNSVFETNFKRIQKSNQYEMYRLPQILIPGELRVARGNGSILKYLWNKMKHYYFFCKI